MEDISIVHQEQDAGQNPFEKIKIRSLLIWLLVGAFAVPLASSLLKGKWVSFSASLESEIWFFWFHIVVLIWVLWNFRRWRVSMRRMMGVLPGDHRWLTTVGVVIPLMLFSLGSGRLVYYFSSLVSPSFTKEWFAPEEFSTVQVAFLIIAVPVIEELFFRGVLLHRWTVKWNIKLAILTSTFVFGILHKNFVGGFAYGFVLAALYIRTRALIIPIICHVLINGLALGMGIAWDSLSSFGIIHIFNRLLGSQPWFGLICLALSVPWVAHFLYKNRPSESWSAPYFT